MRRIRLVTRADDAGLCTSANRAVRAAVRQGIVRNVSLLAPAPDADDAAATLLDLGEQVDFGLHVCLTSEWANLRWGPVSPVAQVRSLVREDGTFPQDCPELESGSPRLEEIVAEVRAQYGRLRELGFRLSYLDEHMLVGSVGGLSASLGELAAEWGLVYDRSLQEGGKLMPLPGWDGPGEHPGTELADHLSSLQSGTYLIVGHPAFKTSEVERLEPTWDSPVNVVTQRNRERRMFADIEIVDYCETSRIHLTRYSELP
jgi:hypothetical protein